MHSRKVVVPSVADIAPDTASEREVGDFRHDERQETLVEEGHESGGRSAEIPVACVERAAIESGALAIALRSEEHTSELQSLRRNAYAGLCLKKNKNNHKRE